MNPFVYVTFVFRVFRVSYFLLVARSVAVAQRQKISTISGASLSHVPYVSRLETRRVRSSVSRASDTHRKTLICVRRVMAGSLVRGRVGGWGCWFEVAERGSGVRKREPLPQ